MNTRDKNELQKEMTSEVPESANPTVSDDFQNNELQPVQNMMSVLGSARYRVNRDVRLEVKVHYS